MTDQSNWGQPPRPPSPQIRRNRQIVKWVLVTILLVAGYAVAGVLIDALNRL